MKVKECPECRGYVPIDGAQCQNCGHTFWAETPKAQSSKPVQRPYETQMQKDMRNPKKVAFFVICMIVAIALFALAFYFLMGGGTGPDEIKFEIYTSGECTYTFTYLDSNGIHQSQKTVYQDYWVSVTGASNANLVAYGTSSITVKAYINGRLVDEQSGTYVLVSANP